MNNNKNVTCVNQKICTQNFNLGDVFNSSSISRFEFADGTTLSTAELLVRGFNISGIEDDDTLISSTDPVTGFVTTVDKSLYGTNTTDRINALGGNDRMRGAANDASYHNLFEGTSKNSNF